MAKKTGGDDSGGISANHGFVSATLLITVFILGGSVFRAGYRTGIKMADKVLKRHDKDVRSLEKRERKRVKAELKKQKGKEP